MRKPPDWLGIESGLLKDVKIPYGDYVEQLKYRLDFVGSLVLRLHNDAQERESRKHAETLRKTPVYKVGQLVYFLMPSSGALETNTRKFVVNYVGPVRIKSVLDPTHVILEDLSGRTISGVHHSNRIKPAYIRGRSGVISNIEDLSKELESHFCFEQVEDLSQGYSNNHALLSDDGVVLLEATKEFPAHHIGVDLFCEKSRCKNGDTEVLFTNRVNGVVPEGLKEFSEWYDLSLFPHLQNLIGDQQIRTTGSRLNLVKKLNI